VPPSDDEHESPSVITRPRPAPGEMDGPIEATLMSETTTANDAGWETASGETSHASPQQAVAPVAAPTAAAPPAPAASERRAPAPVAPTIGAVPVAAARSELGSPAGPAAPAATAVATPSLPIADSGSLPTARDGQASVPAMQPAAQTAIAADAPGPALTQAPEPVPEAGLGFGESLRGAGIAHRPEPLVPVPVVIETIEPAAPTPSSGMVAPPQPSPPEPAPPVAPGLLELPGTAAIAVPALTEPDPPTEAPPRPAADDTPVAPAAIVREGEPAQHSSLGGSATPLPMPAVAVADAGLATPASSAHVNDAAESRQAEPSTGNAERQGPHVLESPIAPVVPAPRAPRVVPPLGNADLPGPLPAVAEPRQVPAQPLPSASVAPVPAQRRVEIRIGSVDVRAEAAPSPSVPAAARRTGAVARGFDDYRALRSHGSWDI
jgi:S-DNA-T family DNA segregation ATPase FtsK/SpoIIIE